MQPLIRPLKDLLRWSERYTKTDMVYLAHGGFWLNLGSLSVSVFSFLLYLAFAHFLPKETYGMYQYLLSVFAIAGAFTLSGMNSSVAQAVARGYDGTLRESVRIQLRWGIIPLLGGLGGGVYYLLQHNYLLAGGFVLIGVLTPVINAYNTYNAFLTGKKDFKRAFVYNLALNVPFYTALIAASYFFSQALWLLAVNLGMTACMLFILYRQILRTYTPNNAIDPNALSYGKHLSAMGLFGALVGQADTILVFHYLGAVDLAIYAFATAIPDRLGNFLKFIPSAAFPKFAERSEKEIRAHIVPKLWKLGAVALLGAIVYGLLAPLFFHIFFPQYESSILFSQLYAFSLVGIVGNVALTALISQRRTTDLYAFNIASPLIQIILQYAGVILWGLWGLVAARIFSTFVTGAIALFLLLRDRATPQTAR